DLIFAPLKLAAVGGHGAELRPVPTAEPQRRGASLCAGLKSKIAPLTQQGPGILFEEKSSLFPLHFRLSPRPGPPPAGGGAPPLPGTICPPAGSRSCRARQWSK